jgi:hypothetical protein
MSPGSAMSAPTVEDWAEAFIQASNGDPELDAHGRYYTCSYLLDMEEHTVVVWMVAGKIIEITVDAGPLDVPHQFVVRAGAETWRHFGVPHPEPMYHGIWAATFRRDMVLEGDVLVLMQNLRCFTRQMELLRVTGVPV